MRKGRGWPWSHRGCQQSQFSVGSSCELNHVTDHSFLIHKMGVTIIQTNRMVMQLSESSELTSAEYLDPHLAQRKCLRNGWWVALPSVPHAQCRLWEARMGLKQGDDGRDDGKSSLSGQLSNPIRTPGPCPAAPGMSTAR